MNMHRYYVKLGTMPGMWVTADQEPQVGQRLRIREVSPESVWMSVVCDEARPLSDTVTLYLLSRM